ncbi:MAG: carbohydrate ABC transporter permease [Thermotoga sp.]|nr:MAG: carbohydrate ABC transporter permease [Thermotoga sp.]
MIRISTPWKIIIFTILIVHTIIVMIPFSVIFFNSFKTLREIFLRPFSLPEKWSFDNYIKAWEKAELGKAYMNSAFVTSTSVLSILFLSSMIAFVISRYDFPYRRLLYLYIISGLALPARLAIIPIYLILKSFHLLDSLFGLIFVYSATGIPFSVFLLKHFMDMVPKEIEESAIMDGASPWKVFTKIILPLSKPAIVVVTIVNAVGIWNDFFFPLILINSKEKETIPLAVSTFFGEYSHQWELISTALWIAVFPMIVVFFILSKYFISGMTQGALKG